MANPAVAAPVAIVYALGNKFFLPSSPMDIMIAFERDMQAEKRPYTAFLDQWEGIMVSIRVFPNEDLKRLMPRLAAEGLTLCKQAPPTLPRVCPGLEMPYPVADKIRAAAGLLIEDRIYVFAPLGARADGEPPSC